MMSAHSLSLLRPPTTLQVSPAFGAFFLIAELSMNECAQRNRHLQRTAKEAAARRMQGAAAASLR